MSELDFCILIFHYLIFQSFRSMRFQEFEEEFNLKKIYLKKIYQNNNCNNNYNFSIFYFNKRFLFSSDNCSLVRK